MHREIEFRSQEPGVMIRADLYTPDEGEGPWPVVIMGGGWCYVKELIMPEYAKFFIDQGVAALIFDYRHFGASDGEPRQHIDPWKQIDDYRSAVDAVSYLDEFPELDPERIAVWGISYSGGHVLAVGALDPRVKCVVSQIPVLEGSYNAMRAHGSVGFRELTALVAEDRKNRYLTGEHGHLPHSGDPKKEVVMWPHPETKPVFMKIKETTAPRHEHYSTIQSVEYVLQYNMRPYLPMILDTPTLMIVAEGDDLTMWEREVPLFSEIAARQAADWLEQWLVTPYS
jgi:predicted acyl esterase